MTTPELERALTETLHRHAEVAMSRTDTHEQLTELQTRVDQESGGRRRRALATAAVAAVAVLVLGAIAYAGMRGEDPAQGPVDQGGSGQTFEERVAQQFADDYGAGDVDAALASLAPDAALPSDWDFTLNWLEAASVRHQMGTCQTIDSTSLATRVVCPFDYFAYRSDEMGMAPFGTNIVTVLVRDGAVRSFVLSYNYQGNGQSALYEDIRLWVRARHPGEWRFLGSDAAGAAEPQRWIALWQQRTQEYADAHPR